MKIVKKILSWAGTLVPLMLILLAGGMRLKGQVPSLFGYSLYVIVSPSMEPELKVGDVILTEKYGKNTPLEPGDVVTYEGRIGELAGKRITHQVTALQREPEGLCLTTKGLANALEDPKVQEEQLISVMKRRLPLLGFLYGLISSGPGFLLLFVLPMLYFIGAELLKLKKELKEERTGEEHA